MNRPGSARGRTTIWVVAATLAAFGALAAPRWRLASGEQSGIRAVVEARLAGQGQNVLVSTVAAPLERRLLSLPEVATVTSETSDGSARWTIDSLPEADADSFALDVERTVYSATGPAIDPAALAIDFVPLAARPAAELFVTGGDPEAQSHFVRGALLPAIAQLSGSGRIETLGLTMARATVEPRAADLTSRGLTALDVLDRLRAISGPVEVGRVRDGARIRPLAIDRQPRSLAELAALSVGGPHGEIHLGDVATIGSREVGDGSWAVWNGSPAVRLRIFVHPTGDPGDLARRAADRVAELNLTAPPGMIVTLRPTARGEPLAAFGVVLLAVAVVALLSVSFVPGLWVQRSAAAFLTVPLALLAAVAPVALWTTPTAAGVAAAAGAATGLALALALGPPARGARGRRAVGGAALLLMGAAAARSAAWGLAMSLVELALIATAALVGWALMATVQGGAVATLPESTPDPDPIVGPRPRRAAWAALAVLSTALLVFLGHEVLRRSSKATTGAATPELVVHFMLVPAPPPETAPDLAAALAERAFREVRDLGPRSTWASYRPAALEGPAGSPMTAPEIVLDHSAAPGTIGWRWRDRSALVAAQQRLKRLWARTPGVLAWVSSSSEEPFFHRVVVSAATNGEAATLTARVTAELAARGVTGWPAEEFSRAPAVDLAWKPWIVDHTSVERDELAAEVAAALGHVEAGAVAINGLEPAVWLTPTVPRDLARLPIRLATPAGAPLSSRVVPLAAVARFAPAERAPTVLHVDGRPAVGVLVASAPPTLATPHRPDERIIVDGLAPDRSGPWAAILAAACLLLGLAAATAVAGSLDITLAAMTMGAWAASGSLALLWCVGRPLAPGGILGTALVVAVAMVSAILRHPPDAAPRRPDSKSAPVVALALAGILLGLTAWLATRSAAGSATGLRPLVEAIAASSMLAGDCALALLGGSAALLLGLLLPSSGWRASQP